MYFQYQKRFQIEMKQHGSNRSCYVLHKILYEDCLKKSEFHAYDFLDLKFVQAFKQSGNFEA